MAHITVYVNPSAASNGSGSVSNPFNTWSSVTFSAGNTYLQMAGTKASGNVMVTGSGTAAAPITIGAYGSGAAPEIAGSVIFDGASNVSLTGFSISAGQQAAVAIEHGSANIKIQSNTIGNSMIGVWIGAGAGGGDLISGNTMTGNSMFGIGVDSVINAAGQQSTILGNTISLSGSHGIELQGSNFLVKNNTVQYSGQSVSGSSGIHVFSGGVASGFGSHDTITGNTVVGTADPGDSDGNGIELDQFTSSNTVSANTICGNDGGGIVVYDSSNNTISGNMVFANSARANVSVSPDGEIVLASTASVSSGNTISGNVFSGISSYAPVAFVDVASSKGGNVFFNNAFEDFGGFAMYDWGGTVGGDTSYWQGVAGGANWFGGVAQGASAGLGGSGYLFDFTAVSPFGAGFRFPWQLGGAYG